MFLSNRGESRIKIKLKRLKKEELIATLNKSQDVKLKLIALETLTSKFKMDYVDIVYNFTDVIKNIEKIKKRERRVEAYEKIIEILERVGERVELKSLEEIFRDKLIKEKIKAKERALFLEKLSKNIGIGFLSLYLTTSTYAYVLFNKGNINFTLTLICTSSLILGGGNIYLYGKINKKKKKIEREINKIEIKNAEDNFKMSEVVKH